jgi:hypothetical protein
LYGLFAFVHTTSDLIVPPTFVEVCATPKGILLKDENAQTITVSKNALVTDFLTLRISFCPDDVFISSPEKHFCQDFLTKTVDGKKVLVKFP